MPASENCRLKNAEKNPFPETGRELRADLLVTVAAAVARFDALTTIDRRILADGKATEGRIGDTVQLAVGVALTSEVAAAARAALEPARGFFEASQMARSGPHAIEQAATPRLAGQLDFLCGCSIDEANRIAFTVGVAVLVAGRG